MACRRRHSSLWLSVEYQGDIRDHAVGQQGHHMRYSALKVFTEGLFGNKGWTPAWRDPAPKAEYDAIIIGGGGHGLATAYYLAKNHGLTNVAVLEKGYLGGGNVGRNTTIVRANYFIPGNSEFYSHSLKLWEGLEGELNYNVMHSQRGQVVLFHSDGQRDAQIRRANAIVNQGDDAEIMTVDQLRAEFPYLDYEQARFPIYGGMMQRRAGTARHDAVAWGYARGADSAGRGPDPELRSDRDRHRKRRGQGRADDARADPGEEGRHVCGGPVGSGRGDGRVAAADRKPCAAGFRDRGAEAGDRRVISFGMGHFYISQSDKGGLVFGGDIDMYASYAARGNLPMVEHVMEAGMTLMPMIGRARVLRSWGGIMDMTPDGSPIIDKTPIEGLFVDAGWNYGGFKATPGHRAGAWRI